MNLIQYAKDELDRIGMTAVGDEYNVGMRNHILQMVELFANERHSGFSAGYAIQCLEKLLRFEPLSPLTGEDSEWNYVGDLGDEPVYQNKRCSRVFKNSDGKAYDIDSIIYWSWCKREDGTEYKNFYSKGGQGNQNYIEFPYTPTTTYVEDTD